MANPPSGPFPLLKLPKELRQHVWRFLLVWRKLYSRCDRNLCHESNCREDRCGHIHAVKEDDHVVMRCCCRPSRLEIGYSHRAHNKDREVVNCRLFTDFYGHQRLSSQSNYCNLFSVNRQIRQECLAIHHAENTFSFREGVGNDGRETPFNGAREALGMLSFLSNTHRVYGAEITAGIRRIELDLVGSPVPYRVESPATRLSIVATLGFVNLRILSIKATCGGLSSFVRLWADCFPESTFGHVKEVNVKWAVPREGREVTMTDFCFFASRVRLLRESCLGDNRRVAYAGITARYEYDDGRKTLRTRRFLRQENIVFRTVKEEDRHYHPQHRGPSQLSEFLEHNGAKTTLDLGDWSSALETMDKYSPPPREPSWPQITWDALPPPLHSTH